MSTEHGRCYTITGGDKIFGEITCLGAKNFASKAMVASLLSNDKIILQNVPSIGDIEITQHLIESAGARVTWSEDNQIEIDPTNLSNHRVFMPDSRTNRIPVLLLSVLLHRFKKAIVPTVGGDDIGKRKIDFHLNALSKFGATIEKNGNEYIASAQNGLHACHIRLNYPSVGATETCIFLAVLAKGTSVIKNIAIEPEIKELITMLRSMGAIIFLNSGREVTIKGVDQLSGTKYKIIPDRIEAASWASLACASNGKIQVNGIRPDLLGNFLSFYREIGGGFEIISENQISFFRDKELKPAIIETDVYPGFSTDWQQPFGVLLTQANGMSVIHETVYEQRFGYLDVLKKLGANTQVVSSCLGSLECRYKGFDHPHSAIINGPTKLLASKTPIEIPDIRAGLAYLIAAVLAEGQTTLLAIEQIERGYGNLIKKLVNTNVNIKDIKLS